MMPSPIWGAASFFALEAVVIDLIRRILLRRALGRLPVWTLLVGLFLVTVLAFFMPVAGAQAATAAPARAVPPVGAGYDWGAPYASFPACGSTALTPATVGGWSQRDFVSNGVGTTLAFAHTQRPVHVSLGEPCYDAASPAGQRLRIPVTRNAIPNGGANGGAGCTTAFESCWLSGAVTMPVYGSTSPTVGIRCASVEWSQPPSRTLVAPNSGSAEYGLNTAAATATTTNALWWQATSGSGQVNVTTCPWVVDIHVKVCVFPFNNPTTGAPSGSTCVEAVWSAERWFNAVPYVAAESPQYQICQYNPSASASCDYILDHEQPDGSDFNFVCSGAPAFTWGDWDWLPEFVGHYARCLFLPLNGWDRDGLVQNGVTLKIAPFYDAATTAAGAIDFYEGCGVIFDMDFMGQSLAIDTCSLGTDFELLKTVFRWGILLPSAALLVSMFIGTAVSPWTKRGATPLASDESAS